MRGALVRASATLALVWLVASALSGALLQGGAGFRRAALGIVLVGGTGLALRLLRPRRGRGLVYAAELLAYLGFAAWQLWPYRHPEQLRALLAATSTMVTQNAAPLGSDPGLEIGYALVMTALFLLSELFVFVTRQPGYTIVPLAVWYAVYAFLPRSTAPLLNLAVAVGGYAAILGVDTVHRGLSWPRHLAGDSGKGSDVPLTVSRLGALVVLPVLVASVLLSWVMPMLPHSMPGNDLGSGDVTLTDPRLDLRQNLKQNEVQTALRYTSDADEGVRLQIATLNRLTRNGWEVGTMGVSRQGNGSLTMGAIPGVAKEPTPRERTSVRVEGFSSNFLPLPYAPRRVAVSGRWGVDPETLVTFSTSSDPRSALYRLAYTVDATPIEPTVAQLQAAGVSGAPAEASRVPAELSPEVIDLARRITARAETPAEKAAALQAYLRSSRFRYDLHAAPDSSGVRSIEEFVLRSRTGYCEQFAGAMSAMARSVGLPSRVVIGFLPGKKDGSVWTVTNHDMHAWSEIWFTGYGWVRFDATPGSVSGREPAWTPRVRVGDARPPTATPSARPSPSRRPTATPTPTPTPTAPPRAGRDGGLPGWLLPLVGGVVLVAGVAGAPRGLRSLRRRGRLAQTEPRARVLAAWDEVRDLVIDHGGSWTADSPRALADRVGLSVSPRTDDALWTLALAVERARFGRGEVTEPAHLADTLSHVRADLSARAPRATRLRALWLPASLWRGRAG